MSSRKHRQTPSADLMALAPFYVSDTSVLATRATQRLVLAPLPYSREEIQRVQEQVGGNDLVLSGQQASKKLFLKMAGQYSILHLATHGKANHREGDFSFLAFATEDPDAEKGLLSVGELYNCSLNADLVVLSACETGIGEEQRGEGVVSLARAFAFAGAKSIVSSLWSVNDKSTMQVMDGFYAELKAGRSKNLALNTAKQQYLEQHPGKASHPFFWAGFVAVGDMSALQP
jgi:CHAT domain-containing protein